MNKDMLRLLDYLMMMEKNEETNRDDDEMEKLAKLLTEANIPFERFRNFGRNQICYYGTNGRKLPEGVKYAGPGYGAICSVIKNPGSYGYAEGLLEISGLMTEEEIKNVGDTVLGYLDAENVFKRIKKHFEENKEG